MSAVEILANGANSAASAVNSLAQKMQSLSHGDSLETVSQPTGLPGRPYVISSQDGEIIYIPLSKSATRLLVTGKETEDAFAIVGSGGSQGDPIGFHYHHEAHDVFLCLQGNVNVWANDQCRTMGAGDFASVPPGTIHQYQILGTHSEMVGLIVPGGWEEFFRFIGEPYDGPMWPMEDNRNFFEVLLPKLKAAAEQFDMVPCPQHKSVEPQAWAGSDNKLPGKLEPYFLRSGTGPAYAVGGTVCRPLITTAESAGKFAIGSIEASSHKDLQSGIFDKPSRRLKFDTTHHAFQVVEGVMEFTISDTKPSRLGVGELLYVPKGNTFSFTSKTRCAKMYVFGNDGGLIELMQRLGERYESPVLPEKASAWDETRLKSLGESLGFQLVEA